MLLPWRMPNYGPEIQTSITVTEARALQVMAFRKQVLEIGAAYGYSTILMAEVAEHVLSIDPHVVHDSLETHTRNLITYNVDYKVGRLVGPNTTMLPPLDDRQFDVVFVDGDHTAEGVRFDLEQSLRLVKLGGVIAFHDWGEETCPSVRPTLEEWRKPDYVIDTLAVYRV